MSEIALYRKYRPAQWDEVQGQDHVIKVLKGAIENDKVAHAYLFTGRAEQARRPWRAFLRARLASL